MERFITKIKNLLGFKDNLKSKHLFYKDILDYRIYIYDSFDKMSYAIGVYMSQLTTQVIDFGEINNNDCIMIKQFESEYKNKYFIKVTNKKN